MIMRMPNFRGQRVFVLHPQDRNCAAIAEQLERLGTKVTVTWPARGITARNADIVFFDSDVGFDGMFGWPPGKSEVPLIAILGSEAPGRIEWALSQEPSAYLMKPVGSTGVFSALCIACHSFALKQGRDAALRQWEERVQMRETLLRAVVTLMHRYDVDAEQALRMLRRESMRRRTTLEAISTLVLDGKWIPMSSTPDKQSPGRARGRV
jgi:AmiR/NasT family two-component response regulator